MGENPTPSPVVTTSIVSSCPSCFSALTTAFFSSSPPLRLSFIYCTQIKIFKQTSNVVMFQVENLLGLSFLPWIRSRFFHLWFRSLTVRTQPHLSTPIYHSSHLGTFNFQSSWTYYCMKDTSLFSLLSSIYAFPLSETIFFHHNYFVIANVKLCQMTLTLTPLPPTSTPTSQSQMGSRTVFINLPWHFSMSCIRIIFVFV